MNYLFLKARKNYGYRIKGFTFERFWSSVKLYVSIKDQERKSKSEAAQVKPKLTLISTMLIILLLIFLLLIRRN